MSYYLEKLTREKQQVEWLKDNGRLSRGLSLHTQASKREHEEFYFTFLFLHF